MNSCEFCEQTGIFLRNVIPCAICNKMVCDECKGVSAKFKEPDGNVKYICPECSESEKELIQKIESLNKEYKKKLSDLIVSWKKEQKG